MDPAAGLNKFTACLQEPAAEAQYRTARLKSDLRQMRWALALAAIANFIFAVLDYLVITDNVWLAVGIRLFWGGPIIGVAYYLTTLAFFERRIYLLGWLGIGISTVLYGAINLLSGTPDVYLSGYVLILFFLLILFPLSFPATMTIGATFSFFFAAIAPLNRSIQLGDLLTIYSQYLVTLMVGGVAVYLINSFRRQDFLNATRIAQQQQQYRGLLNRILPASVVNRMQAGESRIADKINDVTVLFADIVGFTESAAQHGPEDVIGSLDHLFARFDELAAQHGVEKIKTIGDAYMAATGVPDARDDHREAMANFALGMMATAAACTSPDGETIRLRVGFHTGPVIAGVIGENRFGYDLWGHTVNIASRMESSSEPGLIQVTETVYEALKDKFDFRSRGVINIKGIGDTQVWALQGRKS
jgi:class 3 adenylate cyclase